MSWNLTASLRAGGDFPSPVNVWYAVETQSEQFGRGGEPWSVCFSAEPYAGPCFYLLPLLADPLSGWCRAAWRCTPRNSTDEMSLVLVSSLHQRTRVSSCHFGVWFLETVCKGRPSCSGFVLSWGQTGHQLLTCTALWVRKLCKINLYLLLALPLFFSVYFKRDGCKSLFQQLTV